MGDRPGILAVIDCDVKDLKGLALYKEAKKLSPDSPIIMLSSNATIPEAVESAKLGVSDFIRKPVLAEKLLASVKQNLLMDRSVEIKLRAGAGTEWLLGRGARIRALLKNIEAAISERKNVLFISEPGIDVLRLAKLMRDFSSGSQKLTTIDMLPFQRENLESIFWTVLQEALIDSDIIYFERFSAANEKLQTSILDYIKNKTLRGQVKLVAGVQSKEVGEIFNDWEKINVPNLRDRKEDMPEILAAYIDRYTVKYGKKIEGIGIDVLKIMNNYGWPGNYRELECEIENAVMACESGSLMLKDIQLGSKMVYDNLQSAQTENLLDFRNNVEKTLVKIFQKKTGSVDMTANLLDIPKSRISEGLPK
jgi:DNA-binding NtrC family response regulator